MELQYHIPTKVFFGERCIQQNQKEIRSFGNKALLVTGRSSAKICGAYNEMREILDGLDMIHQSYEEADNNPGLDNVKKGAEYAKEFNPDFLIAIGGGSSMDGAKAIAVLAVNDMTPLELITDSGKIHHALPILAVPTTAGTGSEVTPYSILTIPEMKTKKSFMSPLIFPVMAFLDPRYTATLSDRVATDTAFDAFSHLLESLLSRRSHAMVETLSYSGLTHFAKAIPRIRERVFNGETRSHLLYASLLGGMAIAHTGTTLIHAMGYSLTYFKGLSHGNANALLVREYLKFNYPEEKDKIDRIIQMMGFDSIDSLGEFLETNVEHPGMLSEGELEEYTRLAGMQSSIRNNPRKTNFPQLREIYRKAFRGNRHV